MAQHKYSLVTVPTEPAGPPRHHSWYKERLDLKFMKHGQKSRSLDGRKWTLLAGNMDDFRTGLPAPSAYMVVKGRVNPIPLVDSSRCLRAGSVSETGRSKRRRLPSPSLQHGPGQSTLYSKVGPQRQSKLGHLQQLEDRLLRHPLSLYPHLQESIPAEVAGEVMTILDGDSTVECSVSQEAPRANCQNSNHLQEDEEITKKTSEDEQHKEVSGQETVYRWPLKRTEQEIREEQLALAKQKVISPAQEARVSEVTRDLVQWGRELGGSEQTSSIDEATVKSLFTSDYETRPVTAPIQVVDFPNVPFELQQDSRYPSASSHRSSLQQAERRRRRTLTNPVPFSFSKSCERHVKSRYGAWYLPRHLWKLQKANEPLCDPRQLTSESAEELAQRDEELNYKVSQLHGAQAFRDHYTLRKPGAAVPSFLQCIGTNSSSKNLFSSSRHMRS